MEEYEVNILRRNGNWKKVKSKDLLLDTADQNEAEYKHIEQEEKISVEHKKEENFLNYINEVNSIIAKFEKLENDKTLLKNQLKIIEAKFIAKFEKLENDKTLLKNQLKIIEAKFQSKKHQTEEKIKSMSKENEILDKTITVIKNLKNF